VNDLKFEQPARRNLLAPVLIAFMVLGVVLALVLRYTPRKVAEVEVLHIAAYPAHTVFKSDTILVGRDRSQDDLYVPVRVQITDRLNLPIFLKDFTGTVITSDGEEVAGTAAQQSDLDNIYTSFPALRSLSSAPLLRETLINPDSSAEGMVLLHFPVSAEIWNHRRSGILNIDLYHQGPLAISLPKGIQVSSPDTGKNATQQ
jgi:hypothetical protein